MAIKKNVLEVLTLDWRCSSRCLRDALPGPRARRGLPAWSWIWTTTWWLSMIWTQNKAQNKRKINEKKPVEPVLIAQITTTMTTQYEKNVVPSYLSSNHQHGRVTLFMMIETHSENRKPKHKVEVIKEVVAIEVWCTNNAVNVLEAACKRNPKSTSLNSWRYTDGLLALDTWTSTAASMTPHIWAGQRLSRDILFIHCIYIFLYLHMNLNNLYFQVEQDIYLYLYFFIEHEKYWISLHSWIILQTEIIKCINKLHIWQAFKLQNV